MLERFFQRRSGKSTPADDHASFERLNSISPLINEPDEHQDEPALSINGQLRDERAFLCREAILDRDQRVAGYEFMLHRSLTQRVKLQTSAIARLYDIALIAHMLAVGIDRLLGKRMAFVPLFTLESLNDKGIDDLSAAHCVLSFDFELFRATPFEDVSARIAELRQRGFRICVVFDGRFELTDLAVYRQVDFLAIDLSRPTDTDIASPISAILSERPAIQLLAKNIVLHEEFNAVYDSAALSQQVQYFQGPFVTSREPWEDKPIEASKLRIIELLNKVKQEVDSTAIADTLRRDPVLLYKLLRFVNSPLTGLRAKVETPEQAVMVIGRDKLYGWLSLLLFVSGEDLGEEFALLDNALIRARFMEQIGKPSLGEAQSTNLFLTGIFSLLDVLLKQPMHRALGYLNLPQDVVDALLHDSGPCFPYLQLAIACENATPKELAELATPLTLTEQDVNREHIEAIVWANRFEDE